MLSHAELIGDRVMRMMKVGGAYQATCKQIQFTVEKGNIHEPSYGSKTLVFLYRDIVIISCT